MYPKQLNRQRRILIVGYALMMIFWALNGATQETYKVNGSAKANGNNCFTLTPNEGGKGGSVWYQNYMSLNTNFDFRFTVNLGSNANGADGIAFVLQPLSTNQGGTGSDLGYGNISPSLAVEYDTYRNQDTKSDPAFDHIAIQKNGNTSHKDSGTVADPVQASASKANIKDGINHTTRITWDAEKRILRVFFDSVERLVVTIDIIKEIFNGNPNVYWGFTGSTGLLHNLQSFCVQSLSFQESVPLSLNVSRTNVTCYGRKDGTATAVYSGGRLPYEFGWSNGATTPSIANLAPGTYRATVIDANNDTITEQVTIAQPPGVAYYRDADGDGFGNRSSGIMVCSSDSVVGYVTDSADCDDSRVLYQDNDKDGFGSNNNVACGGVTNNLDCADDVVLFLDSDGDNFGSNILVHCDGKTNNLDCNDNDLNEHPGQVWYIDSDGDRHGFGTPVTQCQRPSNGYLANELISVSGDCDDTDRNVWRTGTFYRDSDGDTYTVDSAALICFGEVTPTGYRRSASSIQDCNDFDASVDSLRSYFIDADNDGYANGVANLCAATAPSGYRTTSLGPDCNDNDASIYFPLSYYRDADSDGFGDSANSITACSSTPPIGFVVNASDCNDQNANELPGQTWHTDKDGDRHGFGNPVIQCQRPVNGYLASELISVNSDCDDANQDIWRRGNFHRDSDGDGYTVGSVLELCYGEFTPTGFQQQKSIQDDCNDGNDRIYPAVIVFVNASATTGKNNGTSWINAFTNLQDALTNAGSCTDSVQLWIATGTYYPDDGSGQVNGSRSASFILKNKLRIYGGFAGGETQLSQRNWQTNITTLSGDLGQNDGPNFTNNGDNAFHVLRATNLDSTAVMDGLVISGGNANGTLRDSTNGGGMTILSSTLRIVNCRFVENAAVLSGGGIYNHQSSPVITNCSFTGNLAANFGGGMYNSYSSPQITSSSFATNKAAAGGGMFNQDTTVRTSVVLNNCSFSGNSVRLYGGGIYNSHSSPLLNNCSFIENTTYVGGGLYNIDTSKPVIINTVFSGNRATSLGGGIYNNNSSPELLNCSFTKNMANSFGGGMDNSASSPRLINCSFSGNRALNGGGMNNDGSSPVLINCILWGNTTTVPGVEISTNNSTSADTDSAIVHHSIVKGGYGGKSNLNVDPLFVDTAAGNLRLRPCSPAINKGVDTVNRTTLDLAGMPRIVMDTIDMGAYEFQGPACRNIPLPVTFVSVNALPQREDVQVTWTVAAEQNLFSYIVEHSIDGRTFNRLGEVGAANRGTYGFLHSKAGTGQHYYRIRSQEQNGGSQYSPVVKAVIGKGSGYFLIAPNPVESYRINLQFYAQQPGRYWVRLVSSTGQHLLSTNLQHAGGTTVYSLLLAKPLPAGIYNLEIHRTSGERITLRLLRQ